MNSDDHSRSIVSLPDTSLALSSAADGRVLSEMAGDTLALAREPLFKIGEYEWCEADYRQILMWAGQLAMKPEEVIRRLLESDSDSAGESLEAYFVLKTEYLDGRIIHLNWNCERLPVHELQWVNGLHIESLTIKSNGKSQIEIPALPLPKLRGLYCENLGIHKLDLSLTPMLEKLFCDHNQLLELDVSNVPKLELLGCSYNQLAKLDLSHLSMLSKLNCEYNKLNTLNLPSVSGLFFADCSNNQLYELNLAHSKCLMELQCRDNLIESPTDAGAAQGAFAGNRGTKARALSRTQRRNLPFQTWKPHRYMRANRKSRSKPND